MQFLQITRERCCMLSAHMSSAWVQTQAAAAENLHAAIICYVLNSELKKDTSLSVFPFHVSPSLSPCNPSSNNSLKVPCLSAPLFSSAVLHVCCPGRQVQLAETSMLSCICNKVMSISFNTGSRLVIYRRSTEISSVLKCSAFLFTPKIN